MKGKIVIARTAAVLTWPWELRALNKRTVNVDGNVVISYNPP